MRRKEKEITDTVAVEEIVEKALVCRLAMTRGDQPYLVPLCFGYRERSLYFHCAREGMKLDILKENDRVTFEMEVDCEIVKGADPCGWGVRGRSVIGFGRAFLVEAPESKREALDIIMQHYGAEGPFAYKEKGLEKAAIIRVDIERMSGKKLA